MDFRKLLEGACGQSNPLVGLASHVTRDTTYQGATNFQSPSNEFANKCLKEDSIFPQTFRMDDIIQQQITNVETETVVPPKNSWVDEFKNQFNPSNASGSVRTTQEANWSIMNASQHESFFSQYQHFPTPQLENRSQIRNSKDIREEIRLDGSSGFVSYVLENEVHPINNLHRVQEYEKLQKEIEEAQNEFWNDNPKQLQENNIETDEPKEEKAFIYFDGLCTEDVHKAETPDIVRSEAENFTLFFINYVKKFQDRDFDAKVEKEYIFRKDNPYFKKITPTLCEGKILFSKQNYAEAVLYFEAVVQVRPNCTKAWKYLVDSLKNNGQYYDAFWLAKKVLHLNPNYFSRSMYYFLFDEQYYYQGCQVILNWLRNHPDYRDIVPSFYTMEDKSSTLVEKQHLADLQKMLIKAAQRRPIKPDYGVQVALSKLLEISRDYEKSSDCMIALVNCNTQLQGNWLNVGFNFLQSNEPHKALEVIENLRKLTFTEVRKSKCDEFSGLLYLYLKDYRKAGQYFVSALIRLFICANGEVLDRQKINMMWTRLHLCAELMRRQDLLELVKEKNWLKLCDEFSFLL